MSKKFQRTLTASAILLALSSVALAETPTTVTWNSTTVPQLSSQYQFTGKDVSGLTDNFWTPLTVNTGASGAFEDLNINIQALGPQDGTSQDKQILGIEINGGTPEFSGEKLSVTINTDFVGGGNNQATGIDFYSAGTTTISAQDVSLRITSTAINGKSVYGIGLGSGGTLNITSKTLNIDLNTSTVRNDSSAENNYSQAIGLDVYQNGLLQISEDTLVTINVTSNGETKSTDGKDGATSAYGILYEGGRGDINGKVDITVAANGGNAVGVGVTNYFYNTSMGENWGSTAANLGDVKVYAESKTGKAAAMDAQYTSGNESNDVILKVNGNAELIATTESGEASGVSVSGPTNVEFDGNLTASATATGQSGVAYSVKTATGKLSLNGAHNILTGNVDVSDKGTLALGANSNTTVDGNITTTEGTNLDLNSAELILAKGNRANIEGSLHSTDGTITLNEVSETPVLSVASLNGDLTVAASGELNDTFGSVEEAAKAMRESVSVTSEKDSNMQFVGKSSAIADGWTADANGKVTKVTENESLNAFENFNAMTLVAWRGENNHLVQRLGDIRDNVGAVGAWARVYGYDSKFSDVVSIKYKSNAIQAGTDFRFSDNYVAGVALSYTDGEGEFSNGSADAESYTLAAYLTGFFPCGGYFDVIGRVGRLSTDIVAANQTNVMKASYDNTALGLSAELGYRYDINTMFYIEPQAELSYAVALGDDFTASNGLKVEQDDYQSLVGRLGARIGANFADNKGSVYMTASVNHDFLGDADSTAKLGNIVKDQNVDAGGTWVSYGIGAQFNTSANLNFYGSLEKSSGSEYREYYRYNIGLRYIW